MPPSAQTDLPVDEDLRLVRAARAGHYDAFAALVARYQPRVYGLARRIVGQPADAEDVTQQTFLSLVEHLQDFREESGVAAWVLRIAANHALKLLRKRRGLPTVPLNPSRDPDDTYATVPHPEFIADWRERPEDLALRHEVREALEGAMLELDPKYRIVFALRDLEGLPTKEVAEVLELTESTVKVRLLRARLMLREKLTRLLGDEATRVIPDHHH